MKHPSRLQANGTKSSKQFLVKVSGKENRHVKHVNHEISKAIIQEALASGCDTIAMEDLTNIRKRIKARKRVRSRLHRWAWAHCCDFDVPGAVFEGVSGQVKKLGVVLPPATPRRSPW